MASGYPPTNSFSAGTAFPPTPMAESAALETSVPEQSTDVLLLVENSQAMSYIWDDLRDRHLQQLMDKLLPASQATSHLWVLESQPSQASSTTQPRQYHDSRHALSEVFLNYMPENRISSSTVGFAAQFLAGLANPGGTQCSLHLIIVAVSTLVDDGDAGLTSEMNVASQHSTWSQLAEKLAQTSIYCHTLTTRAKEDMSALTTLFNETLRLGCTVEDLDSFPADSEVALRCSTSPAALNTLPSYGQPNQPPRPVRIAMPPRRNTFPQDSGYAEPIIEESQPQTSSEMDPPPSLVSQLQQVHGLTKKKVYGAKPQRRPFFKDERVERQERNFSLPAAVAMVPVPPPYLPDTMIQQHAGISASGGRVMSLSKADRHARLQAGPIDMQGRRSLAWSGRNSRIASPELLDPTGSPASLGGFSDVSPTASYISSDVSSPITPGSSEDYYGVHLQTAPAPSGFCGPSGIVEGGTSDPTWLQTSYAQGYITSTGQAMAPIAHGYYIPTAPGANPPYYDTSLVAHGVDVYANTGAVVTHEVPPAVVLVAAPSEVLEKPPANPVPLEAVPPPVAVAPPAPVEAPVIQPSPPLPAAPTSTKKAKRRQEAVDDKDYIILDQQFADYGASINEEFANMLKEKDAEKIRELRASGTEELGNSSQPVLNASAVTYTASTDVPQGYLPGRGGDLAAGSSSRAALPQTSPRSNSSVSSMPTPSSPASSTQHAIAAKPSSMLPLPPLATSSTASSASSAPTNEKALYNHSSTSLGFSGSYSASCYPLPVGFAPPSQQMVDPRFLPAIPSCVTVPTGVYQPYRQPVVYSQPTATTNLTSNSLTGWAG